MMMKDGKRLRKLERETGFEPATKSLGSSYATTAPLPPITLIKTTLLRKVMLLVGTPSLG